MPRRCFRLSSAASTKRRSTAAFGTAATSSRSLASPDVPWTRGFMELRPLVRRMSGMSIKDLRKGVKQTVDFTLRNDQGRNKPEDVLSRRVDQQSALETFADDGFGVHLDFHPLQQTQSAHVSHHMVTILALH